MELIIDDREHTIRELASQYTKYDISFDRVETGDYCVLVDDQVVICIERKTWKDLAQSFKDGRKGNLQKMLNLRENTGCTLFYLIEGSPFLVPTRKVAGIEFKNLMAHLDHCQLRDQISVIYCKNLEGVLPRIFELMDNYRTFRPVVTGGTSQRQYLKEKIAETDDMYLAKMWIALPGVSTKTAALLVTNEITFKNIYLEQIGVDEIAKLKYDTGAAIGVKRAQAIISAVQNNELLLLSQIRGLSKTAAEKILRSYSFEDILKGTATEKNIADIQLKTRRVGEVIASRIAKFLQGASVLESLSAHDELPADSEE